MEAVRSNVKITKKRYPSIKRGFEIDVIAVKGNFAFLVSCKGGKKELPKLRLSRMWAEFPEKEIRHRIRENKREIKEVWEQYETLTSNKRILEDLGLEGKKIISLVVYATVQPLSLEKIRNMYEIQWPVLVVTVEELKSIIMNVRE